MLNSVGCGDEGYCVNALQLIDRSHIRVFVYDDGDHVILR